MLMRKFFVWFFGFLFSLSLSLFLITFVINSTIGNSESVKGWLRDANTIRLVVENAPLLAGDIVDVESEDNQTDFTIDLTDEELHEIGRKLVVPVATNLLTPVVEKSIDVFYVWLNGVDYRALLVNLDLSANNAEIKESIEGLVDEYAQKLPTCTGSGEQIFCINEDFQAKKFTDEIFEELANEDGVLSQVELKVDDEEAGTFETIYRVYQMNKALMSWSVVLIILFALAAVFVGRDKTYSTKVLSHYTIGALLLPVVLALLIFVFLPDTFTFDVPDLGDAGDQAVSDITTPLIRTIVFDINRSYLLFAIPLLLGAAGMRFLLYKKQHNPKDKKENKDKK